MIVCPILKIYIDNKSNSSKIAGLGKSILSSESRDFYNIGDDKGEPHDIRGDQTKCVGLSWNVITESDEYVIPSKINDQNGKQEVITKSHEQVTSSKDLGSKENLGENKGSSSTVQISMSPESNITNDNDISENEESGRDQCELELFKIDWGSDGQNNGQCFPGEGQQKQSKDEENDDIDSDYNNKNQDSDKGYRNNTALVPISLTVNRVCPVIYPIPYPISTNQYLYKNERGDFWSYF